MLLSHALPCTAWSGHTPRTQAAEHTRTSRPGTPPSTRAHTCAHALTHASQASDKAVFTFACQLAETVVSLALIRVLTVKSLDESPEADRNQFFNYSLAEPFKVRVGCRAA
jgi:hypothetical protein